jgi:hypothetical protein
MAHSPRHQAARQRGAQTGERFEQAWDGIRQDRCDYQQPIPDAATLAQQRLEAAVVYALVEGFRHDWGVVDRAALAIGSVHPEPVRLTIDPVAGRELEVLTRLLPYYDGRPGHMGNFFGVPGLRLRPDGRDRDYWELGWLDETGRDRGTQLRIRRPRPRPGAQLLPPTPGSGPDGQPGLEDFYQELAPLWHTHPRSISGVERQRDLRGYYDYPADQAKLLSRLLRRPYLMVWPVGRGARAVCLYHHARLDLVVEWFGGPPGGRGGSRLPGRRPGPAAKRPGRAGPAGGHLGVDAEAACGRDGAGAPAPGGANSPRCLAATGNTHRSAMAATGMAARCRTVRIGCGQRSRTEHRTQGR